MVQYILIDDKNIFNLGFGDKDPETCEVSDLIVSDNGDSQKVLATIVETLFVFIENHPDAVIYTSGSSGTRLYQMRINRYLMKYRDS